MTQTLLFNECTARDEALVRVSLNAGDDWRDAARAVLDLMPESEVTGEDVRLACEARGVRPHHHNAWGAVIAGFVRDGLLEPTGRYIPMRAKGSHARKTQVYRRAASEYRALAGER